MKVWIVAKIFRREHPCIHGLTEENQNVRLLPGNGSSEQLPFDVGEIWDISFHRHSPIFLPHLENMVVDNYKYIGEEPDLRSFLMGKVKPWRGGPSQLFNGSLKSGMRTTDLFIAEEINVPSKSIGYWFPDEPLTKSTTGEGFTGYRSYEFLIDYTGFTNAIPEIPAKTLMHISLKPWWSVSSPSNDMKIQKRSYLEIGGWYL